MCRWGQKKWIVLTVLHSEQLHTSKIWVCYHNMCVRWISWQYHFERKCSTIVTRSSFFYNQKDFVTSQWAKCFFSNCCVSKWRFAHFEPNWSMNRCAFQQAPTRNVCIDGKASLSGFYWLCDAAWKLPASLVSGHLIAIVLVSVHWSTSLSLGLDFASVPWSCRSIFWPSVAEICLITDLTVGWPDSREVVVSSDCCSGSVVFPSRL